jgi:hypothetical protein
MTQTIDSTTVRVTADNFVRAESHTYFGNAVKQGGFGKFYHYRDPMPIDDQSVVRANRAKKNADGSCAVQFGGCGGNIPNCLPITPGWNYMVRRYRPRVEILNGSRHFPEAEPAG